MTRKLLIANRGEIAVRIARAAADLDIATVAVHPADDERALHTRVADQAVALEGRGAAAYLDAEQLVRVAVETGCDAVHPGYGFLSESRDFAERCQQAGLTFVGPTRRCWPCSVTRPAPGCSPRNARCRWCPAPAPTPPWSRRGRSATAWAPTPR